MTLTEIKTRCWERLDEQAAASSQRYVDATLEDRILDGARFYVARTGCQQNTQTITQTAYELLYDLDCDVISVNRVLWSSGGTMYPVEPTRSRELDAQWYWWQRQTDTRARGYFLLGMRRLALWPVITTGTQSYTVHYRQDVYDSVAAVPVEDHECLVDYAVARCLLAEGKTEGAKLYASYRGVVDAAARRMASADRAWSMSSGAMGVR